MEKAEILKKLNENPHKNVCLIENFKFGDNVIYTATKCGVVFKLLPSNIVMITDFNGNVGELTGFLRDDFNYVFTPSFTVMEYLKNEYNFKVKRCKQFILNKCNLDFKDGFSVKKLSANAETIKFVQKNYTLSYTESEIKNLIKTRFILGLYHHGEICGFVGMHEERSIGLLEVAKNYRRQGLGSMLTAVAINHALSQNITPFCHIQSDNLPSINMHLKIGGVMVDDDVYWLSK